MAYYIYAIIETDERLDFGPIGLGERPVYTLGPDGLKCVVSDAHLTEYIANTLNLGEHERVLEKVMQGHTILPMSFGSVASDEKEIILMLKKHRATFLRLLNKLTGKVEVAVEILWKDIKAVFSEIAESNPKLKKLKSNSGPKSRDDVIMAGQMVFQLLHEMKRRETETLVKVLRRASIDYLINPNTEDEFVMKGSFLVDKTRMADFDRALDLFDKNNEKRMRIKCIGPTPPYSFANVRVK